LIVLAQRKYEHLSLLYMQLFSYTKVIATEVGGKTYVRSDKHSHVLCLTIHSRSGSRHTHACLLINIEPLIKFIYKTNLITTSYG
jgi:hypothetical protein